MRRIWRWLYQRPNLAGVAFVAGMVGGVALAVSGWPFAGALVLYVGSIPVVCIGARLVLTEDKT